jgi:outer membrane protein assembly factor BamB
MILAMPPVATSLAEPWPCWRGRSASGVTSEVSGWDGSRWAIEKRWQADVGSGLGASPIIVDGRVYVMGYGDGADQVWCLDARDGRTLWKQQYKARRDGRFQRGESPEGPTCTPTFDADSSFLYTRGNDGDLACWDTREQGRNVWQLNLYDTFKVGARRSTAKEDPVRDYGYTGNVLIFKGAAIVEVGDTRGGNIAAFEKRSGKLIWQSQDRHPAGHTCGPVMMTVEDKPCVATFTLEGLCVMRADPGHEGETVAWRAWTMPFNVIHPTPCVYGNVVMITGTADYDSGRKTTFLEVGLKGVARTWEGSRQAFVCSPVAHSGAAYLVDGKVRCMDWATGALKWEGGSMGGVTGSIIVTGDDRLIVWGDRRLLLVESARRSADRYKELARIENPIAGGGGGCYSHAALGEGLLLVKDGDGRLACYAVRGSAKTDAATGG